jgi:hypothetical protein
MSVSAGSPIRKWKWTRWLTVIAIVFAAHVALIFIFGARKPIPLPPVENPPSLTLAGQSSSDWLALNNATLFALPDRNGFAGLMWIALPPLPFRKQEWTEPPRWLAATDSLPVAELGAEFNHFVQTNRFASIHFEFNPPPPLAVPSVSMQPPFEPGSTLQIQGEIVKRSPPNSIKLPSWPYADVIAPSVVQVLVDAAGNVASAVLLPPENFSEPSAVRDADADSYGVELARSFHFAPLAPDTSDIGSNPLSRLAVGRLIFNWQTVPVTNTNESQ